MMKLCLLQMNSTTTTTTLASTAETSPSSSATTSPVAATSLAKAEPWTAEKRHKVGDGNRRIPSKQTCGAYNHTGCRVTGCRYAHKYDLRAGANFYIKVVLKSKDKKGLIFGSQYPAEFKDLRMRNRESMTNTELVELSKMPPLASKVKSTTAKATDSRKKVGSKVNTHVGSKAAKQVSTDMKSKLAQPVGTDAKSEPTKPKLTREEREAQIRAERKEYVDEKMLKAFHKAQAGTQANDWDVLEAERKIINWEADIDMNIKFVALELEFQQCTEVCYMQQELREGKGDQDDRVYNHRFELVTPGELGVFNPAAPCNQSNVGDLAILLKNLNELMIDDGDDSYVCRCCFRSLYPRKTRRERILCACLRCVSVLYCNPWCRDEDAQEHRFSCFLRPAWECQEGTKRRVEKMDATGLKAQPLVEHKIPAIELVHDPEGVSWARPDATAQLVAEQKAAQLAAAPQQEETARGDEEEFNVVGDSDDDAKTDTKDTATDAKDTATDAEDTATDKTAIGGESDVVKAEARAHDLRVQGAILRSTLYKGNYQK